MLLPYQETSVSRQNKLVTSHKAHNSCVSSINLWYQIHIMFTHFLHPKYIPSISGCCEHNLKKKKEMKYSNVEI